MKRELNLEEIREYLRDCSPETKVYLGADSIRYKHRGVFYADYTVVCVVHIDGRHGCRIFGGTVTERDYDNRSNKPAYRLMNEVYKVAELYLKLADDLVDRYVEIHLDINTEDMHASSQVVSQAVGYIRGMCNVTPLVKPNAFAASYAADRLVRGLS